MPQFATSAIVSHGSPGLVSSTAIVGITSRAATRTATSKRRWSRSLRSSTGRYSTLAPGVIEARGALG